MAPLVRRPAVDFAGSSRRGSLPQKMKARMANMSPTKKTMGPPPKMARTMNPSIRMMEMTMRAA
jgi:hypothetical protein